MVIGIDLGTTFSVAAFVNAEGKAEVIANREGDRTTPSAVMFENGNIVVGRQAKEGSVMDDIYVCQFVKRHMGKKAFSFDISPTEKYTAEDISAMILKRVKEDAEMQLGEPVEGAVITVPAYFDDAQRKATQDAGEIAGLKVLGIINEPTAAAIAYCHTKADVGGNVMVFDLGGGTFDITVMQMSDDLEKVKVLSTGGNRNLGGFDFDNHIIMKVSKAFEEKYGIDLEDEDGASQELRLKAESAKKTLSSTVKAAIHFVWQGNALKVEVTREEFESMIHSQIAAMQGNMEIAVDEAGLKWGDISKVLLVGGSTRIPAVQEMIQRVTGIAPSHELHPDEAVALGAAYYAEILQGKSTGKQRKAGRDIQVVDVNSHSLGVIALDEEGVERMDIILPKNTPFNEVREKSFTTHSDQQTELFVRVLEGEDEEDLEYDRLIGKSLFQMEPKPVGSPIAIAMRYDENGIIHVKVIDLAGNGRRELGEMRIERESNLTEAEVEEKKNLMEMKTVD